MKIHLITPEAVFYIADRMRQIDREEVYATRFTDSPADLAVECHFWGENAWYATKDGEPVIAFGAVPQLPGVHSLWAFGTEDFSSVAVSFTKYLKRVMIPRWETEAHRIECKSLDTHTEAHAWLRLLNLEKEATLKKYGKHGEDFYLFAWVKGE